VNVVQGQEFAETYLLEYRRVDTGPWIRFRDRNNNEVSTRIFGSILGRIKRGLLRPMFP